MNIGNVNSVGVNPYACTYNTRKTTSTGNFAEEVRKAEESRVLAGKDYSSKWDGDMIIPQPPTYKDFVYDSSISNKSKEEMTMDEYKQWFMNEMSQMPVSAWVRSTIVGGFLTITEECFERMKTDPEWENTVLNMVRKMYSVNGIMGTKAIGYQVIGASPEQCYGYAGPIGGSGLNISDDEESWWEKRHKRIEEHMEEMEEQENKSDIIVKPDGSRVLVVTMNVRGMETTMSIEISKPTNMMSQTDDFSVVNQENQTAKTAMEAYLVSSANQRPESSYIKKMQHMQKG